MVGPQWFHGLDAIVDLVVFLVAGLIALAAARGTMLLRERKYTLLAWGFGFVSLSYLSLAAAHGVLAIDAGRVPFLAMPHEMLETVWWLSFAHGALFLAGLVTLVILYHDVRDWGLQSLLFTLVLFAFALSHHGTATFYALVSVLLLSIIIQVYRRHLIKHGCAVVFSGFLLIFLGEVLLALLFMGSILYVLSYVVALAGFLVLLMNQLRVGR